MTARKVAIGCSVVALVLIVAVVIVGVASYRHLSARVPIPPHADLVDAQTLGLAVIHIEPDNPWMIKMMDQLARHSATRSRDADPNRILPLEMVWAARETGPGAQSQVLRLCLSPGGRLVALVSDLMLWKAGRANSAKVARSEYEGEGITSFPGTSFQGFVFVRNTSLVWSSDLDEARHAIDLLAASETRTEAAPPAPSSPPAPAAILSLLPQPGEAGASTVARGVMLNKDGALARALSSLPGVTFDVPPGLLEPATRLSFVFGTTSGDEAAGEIAILHEEGAPAEAVTALATDLTQRIKSLSTDKMSIDVTSRDEPGRAVLVVKVKGLEALAARLPHMVLDIEDILKDIKDAPEQTGQPDQPTKTETPPAGTS